MAFHLQEETSLQYTKKSRCNTRAALLRQPACWLPEDIRWEKKLMGGEWVLTLEFPQPARLISDRSHLSSHGQGVRLPRITIEAIRQKHRTSARAPLAGA